MEKELPKDEKPQDESNWSHDIENRDYYYDDSTGYEVYRPEEDDDNDDGMEDKKDESQ